MSNAESYRSMINGLYGLLDDFEENDTPLSTREMLSEIIVICKSDFNDRFGDYYVIIP
jgi:uncharacterized protein YeeX (DUF496 family)